MSGTYTQADRVLKNIWGTYATGASIQMVDKALMQRTFVGTFSSKIMWVKSNQLYDIFHVMGKETADNKEDIDARDRRESVTLMTPLMVAEDSRHRKALTDIAVDLAGKAAGFRRSLPASVQVALADLVRSMNCYYSNLIEGHDTHPIDIERALKNDYSTDPAKRDLQLEAKAHISVQQWLDGGNLRARAATSEAICDIHRRFCELLPDDMLWIEEPDTHERLRVVPGELRRRDVKVGRHIPISPEAIPRFLKEFESAYQRLGKTDAILAAAAAHHRLLWIHPFLDGNGRVTRLMSHAMLLDALDTGGVWSVARGLARNVVAYKAHLAECDLPRRNDLDGRGNLSEEALASFTRFFLETCMDQVTFMEGLMQPDRLRTRILLWSEEETRLNRLPQRAGAVIEAVLYRGALPRGDVAGLLGQTPRNARRIISELLRLGVLTSKGPRDPLLLAFPAALASRWMPGLFPERAE
jgi:Fic family protein